MGTISSFSPFDHAKGLYVATTATHRWTAIRLRNRNICLVSSLSNVTDRTTNELASIGRVTHLFAPTRYHHAFEHKNTFPNATLCASETAALLLHKVTGENFANHDELATLLPPSMSIMEPEGLKTGEAWIRISTTKGTGWVVGDAIAGPKMSARSSESDQPVMLQTFPKYGIADADAFKAWVQRQIASDHPMFVIPCHGAIVVTKDLPVRLGRLFKNL